MNLFIDPTGFIASVTGHPVALVGLGALVFLSLATLFARGLAVVKSGGRTRELNLRINTWWAIFAFLLPVLIGPLEIALSMMGLISFMALREYFSMVPLRATDRWALWLAYASIPVQTVWIALDAYGFFIITVPVYLFLAMPAILVLSGQTSGFLRSIGTLHWGLMTAVYALGHAAYLLVLPGLDAPGHEGVGLFLFLMLLTGMNDVAQYCWGRSIGGAKVIPSVSPGKSWAGLIGGIATTGVLAALIGPGLTPLTSSVALGLGLTVGIAGFFGDIAMSAVKRDLNLKDTGVLLPGHGGILDRLDSLIFTAPITFHFLRYFAYS